MIKMSENFNFGCIYFKIYEKEKKGGAENHYTASLKMLHLKQNNTVKSIAFQMNIDYFLLKFFHCNFLDGGGQR